MVRSARAWGDEQARRGAGEVAEGEICLLTADVAEGLKTWQSGCVC